MIALNSRSGRPRITKLVSVAPERPERPHPFEGAVGGGVADSSKVLSAFGVPAAFFDSDGKLTDVSPAAHDQMGLSGDHTLQQAIRLACRLVEANRNGRERLSHRACDIAFSGGRATLRAQMVQGEARGPLIVVLFLPCRHASCAEMPAAWGLTKRETDVARLIAAGSSAKAIAAHLSISIHTVRRHTERVFAKLGVSCRAQVVLAVGAGR